MKKVLIITTCMFGLFIVMGIMVSNGKSENSNTASVRTEKRVTKPSKSLQSNNSSLASGSNSKSSNQENKSYNLKSHKHINETQGESNE